MSWTANDRYEARQAPGGLALVQDLLNTRGIHPYAGDLLTTVEDARAWLGAAVSAWAKTRGADVSESVTRLTEDDLPRLRELRATIGALLPGSAAPASMDAVARTQVQLAPGPDGRVTVVPLGAGSAWVASAVWAEILLAQLEGGWPRLKMCRNEECASAFYDASRNNSGVWHSVRTCGNAANLRASRARRRRREAPADPGHDGTADKAPPGGTEQGIMEP